MFLLVDTATLAYRTIPLVTSDAALLPGLASEGVDAFIVAVGGASGAIRAVGRSLPVYAAPAERVADALAELIAGRLRALQATQPPAGARP